MLLALLLAQAFSPAPFEALSPAELAEFKQALRVPFEQLWSHTCWEAARVASAVRHSCLLEAAVCHI